jgi:hypothetical protein
VNNRRGIGIQVLVCVCQSKCRSISDLKDKTDTVSGSSALHLLTVFCDRALLKKSARERDIGVAACAGCSASGYLG